jgi:hypothetical protein
LAVLLMITVVAITSPWGLLEVSPELVASERMIRPFR